MMEIVALKGENQFRVSPVFLCTYTLRKFADEKKYAAEGID